MTTFSRDPETTAHTGITPQDNRSEGRKQSDLAARIQARENDPLMASKAVAAARRTTPITPPRPAPSLDAITETAHLYRLIDAARVAFNELERAESIETRVQRAVAIDDLRLALGNFKQGE